MSSGVSESTRWRGAPVPMFPPTTTRRRPSESTRSISVVVVVFPFVPVTPTMGAGQRRKKSAISVITGTLRCRARRMVGERGRVGGGGGGVPGDEKAKAGWGGGVFAPGGPDQIFSAPPPEGAHPPRDLL